MGLLDFIFGKTNKEKQLDKERQVEYGRQYAVDEHRTRLVDNQKEECKTQSSMQTTYTCHNSSSIDSLVNKCLQLEANGNINELQDSLYKLYTLFNKRGGGHLITNYNRKDNLALCFAFMLQYDWMNDPDIREVWAENGFYCIIDYLQHQPYGRQGQAEAMVIFFVLLCVGRNSLLPKVQDILNKAKYDGRNNVFHQDDYIVGAKNVIDQFSLFAVSGIHDLGQKAIPVMSKICEKYNGYEFFQNTITRRELMKYDVMDVMGKATFISRIIGSILNDM